MPETSHSENHFLTKSPLKLMTLLPLKRRSSSYTHIFDIDKQGFPTNAKKIFK